jgi:uncharacterized protein (DUF1800 family)
MPTASLRPLKSAEFDFWKAQHLLQRAGFGGTPAQVRALAELGLTDAVDSLLETRPKRDGDRVDAHDFDPDIMQPASAEERQRFQRARQSGDEAAIEAFRMQRQDRQQRDRRQMSTIQSWWMDRLIETDRPLEEKMTLFWHGHFATGYRTIEDSYHMFMQNQLFRSHATGNFRSLTHGIIRDPAMLAYLNNDQNRRQRPNENLARELMELFTMGEGNVYTEDDIKSGARALTGYTFADDSFIYRPQLHDDQPKNIMGKSGNWDGDDFVEIIFSKRVVSEYLCLKLYRYFVNDLPGTPEPATQQFIVRLAKDLRDARFELKPVLRTLFRSEHFYDDLNVASMVKNPIQLIVQAIRTLGIPERDSAQLVRAAGMMGQHLFQPPSVKGWDGGRSWINTSTLFIRQNVMVMLLTGDQVVRNRRPRRDRGRNRNNAENYDPMHLVDELRAADGEARAEDIVPYLLRFLLGRPAHESRVQTCLEFLDEHQRRITAPTLKGVLALMTAMPEYQLC